MEQKILLGTEPVGRLLFKLSVPTVIAQVINMMYNLVDRVFIGHIPGEGSLALTGVGVCMPLILLVSALAALVSSGGAPRASIYMGRNENEYAEKILGGCFTLQILVSAVFTFVLLLWNEEMLLAFGASERTVEYATAYMNIYAAGTVFVQLTLGMSAFISCQGFTKVSMCSVVIGAVLNIALDPLLIFIMGMGVKGAALATVISQFASCIWVMAFITGKRTVLRLRRSNMRLSPKVILPCIALGTAVFIMQASEGVISICFNSSLLNYGGDTAVGTMTIMTSVMMFAMLPLQGIGQGAQPVISYNYGAGNRGRVKKAFRLLITVSIIYAVLLHLAIMLVPKAFVAVFTTDRELIEFASPMMRIYFAGLALMGVQTACQLTLTALGKAVSSIIVAVVRKFVLLIPLIYILPHVMADRTMAVYMSEPAADVIAVSFTAVLFAVKFRKILKDMGQTEKLT
ncbi:MAG: MATE family efflux transporter [Anaerovoracaceae bacterium]|nr:MATE family efflux transporter [Anaerovoracaceae bacterium]